MMMEQQEEDTGKLVVMNEDLTMGREHPHCFHGPTVLFYKSFQAPMDGFYACSAYRDRKLCDYYKLARYFTHSTLAKEPSLIYAQEILAKRNHWLNMATGKSSPEYSTQEVPLQLTPAATDKGQAQYLFDDKTVDFFVRALEPLQISRVVCIGAPRLHSRLRTMEGGHHVPRSFLLDIDWRYLFFYTDTEFAWYNMCNNHYFDNQQRDNFLAFLRESPNERILLFVDPPFGCRTELIANTLRQITADYNRENRLPFGPLATFWIFPYFSEHHIRNEMPAMEMTDYKVNYLNHDVFANDGKSRNRKLGSPVRLFTNVSQKLIRLPPPDYKYCPDCSRYTAKENVHCSICNTCPSKNGATYRHCNHCATCVKPSYEHCHTCRRCTRMEGHICERFQRKQTCWICTEYGHVEKNCPLRDLISTPSAASTPIPLSPEKHCTIVCFLCQDRGKHNEKKCPMREKLLDEMSFMGKKTVVVTDSSSGDSSRESA